jgi:polysaccharide deacetylase family protein (PEP-CTERM system associated)
VEEHHRIEAAAGLVVPETLMGEYARRMEERTRVLIDFLATKGVPATFFFLGDLARTHANLIRDVAAAGHEIACHSWDHRRLHRHDPGTFRDALRQSKDALEQASGRPVVGFRAPTFSIGRETGWAIDVLVEEGFAYDSSIFPVRHDLYGMPDAPRSPFRAVGPTASILELPPATYRRAGQNLPVAGGGYFRLFPPVLMRAGIRQLTARTHPPVSMLYFHPWEFDPDQPRLRMGRVTRWRTYVGIEKSMGRLERLLNQPYTFRRAVDVATDIESSGAELQRFPVWDEPLMNFSPDQERKSARA